MSTNPTQHGPRVRIIVVTTTGEIMQSLDLDRLSPSDTASTSLPVNMVFNLPHWPLLATIGTGQLPSRHHIYTPNAYDPESGSLAIRRSDGGAIPWIWDTATAAGRSAVVVNCPLLKAGDGDDRFRLGPPRPNEPDDIESIIDAIRQGLEADLLVSFADFRPNPASGSNTKTTDSDQIQHDLEALLEAARPTGPDDHLLVYLQPRHRAKLLLIRAGAASETSKSLRCIDIVPTILDLLSLPLTSDLPGRSIFQNVDETTASNWPSMTMESTEEDLLRLVIQQVESGNDTLRRHAITALTTAWVCHMRINGIKGSLQMERAKQLVDLQGNPMDWFRLANVAYINGEDELFHECLAFLHEHHAGTAEADLADLISLESNDQEAVNDTLDDHRPEHLNPMLRRIWARAAIKVGRTEVGISHLQHLVSLGLTPKPDRLLLCRLMLDQDRPAEAIRALSYLGSSPDQPLPTQLLRAEALHRQGNVDLARNLLQQLLAAHPGQSDATAMLNKIIGSGDEH
ncbi:MAG: tetratricopeptide repeat protein [Phycisphaerales bacterium]|nr:tetratricopeptide repeat protein [Phycisphaerales bacterium]